jgi:hypothetical protein
MTEHELSEPDAIQFRPTDTELEAPDARRYNVDDIPKLNDSSLHVSSSDWGPRQLAALWVHPLVNLDPNRLVPAKYLPDSHAERRFTYMSGLA